MTGGEDVAAKRGVEAFDAAQSAAWGQVADAPVTRAEPDARAREVLAAHVPADVANGWGSDYGRIKPSEALTAMEQYAAERVTGAKAAVKGSGE